MSLLIAHVLPATAAVGDKNSKEQEFCVKALGMWGQLLVSPHKSDEESSSSEHSPSSEWPKHRDPEFNEKAARIFGRWLTSSSEEVVSRQILMRTTNFNRWFVTLRRTRSERMDPEVRKWWTFFTPVELRVIHRTRKVFIPPSVVRSIGETPYPEFLEDSVVLKSGRKKGLPEKTLAMIAKFEAWILATPLEELVGKLNRRDLWFKNWFWGIRSKPNYKRISTQAPWWTVFKMETRQKLKAAGVNVPDEAFDSPHSDEGGT